MSLADLPATPVTVADLAASGLLPAEIATALGLSEGEVWSQLPEAWAGSAHINRVEAALFGAAIGGTTWKEARTAEGVVRLESDRPANPAAATAILKARKPELYGDAAADGMRLVVDRMGYVRARVSAVESEPIDVTPRE